MTVGARILGGRYRLGSVLGQGGMAVVYRAEDTMLGRTVAVKILREQLGSEHEFLERFNREARAAARLNHPNIILVYDVGQDGSSNYIVMEYVEGPDLREVVRQEGALPPERVVDLGCQIAAALEYAHRKGLIHRDIKTQNVLLTADGKVKVADFGIAVALGESSITADGMVVGSVHYMSPEQAEGRPTTPASDVYSLGVVLYELATGQLPFTAESPLAVARLQLETLPPPPEQHHPGVPTGLSDVILTCLAKDPAERPASAALVAAALRGQRPVTGRQPRVAPALDSTVINPALRPSPSGQAGQEGQPSQQQPSVPGTVILPGTGMPGTVRRPRRPADAGGPSDFAHPQTDVLMPPDRRIGQRPAGLSRDARTMQPKQPRRRVWPWVLAALVLAVVGIRLGTFLAERIGSAGTIAARPTATAAPVIVATAAPKPTQAPPPTTAAKPVAPTPVPASPTAAPKPTTPPQPAGMKTVPHVVQRSESEATSAIRAAGLTVKVDERRGLNMADGQVVAQDPPGGNQVLEGSTVTVIVARERGGQAKPAPKPGFVLVPNVEGMDEREARRTLEAAGFRVVVRQESSRDRKGQVINQNPEAGNSVRPNVPVTITIGN